MSLEKTPSPGPGFWAVLFLLLASARRRSIGRAKRQQELRNQRKGSGEDALGLFVLLLTFALSIGIHSFIAYVVHSTVKHAQVQAQDRDGHFAVSEEAYKTLRLRDEMDRIDPPSAEKAIDTAITEESHTRAKWFGGTPDQHENILRQAYHSLGLKAFVRKEEPKGIPDLPQGSSFPRFMGFLVFLFWGCMMVFQGEGLEMDLQRRRHPMWEWLFSHPAPPAAVFFAEMLSPLAANMIYLTSPVFLGVLYGLTYGVGWGIAAAVLAGTPLAIAAACAGKACETAVILRFSPRSRGAVLGILGWFGYAITIALLFSSLGLPKIVGIAYHWLGPLADVLPWPWLGYLLGVRSSGSLSFSFGLASCWLASILLIAGAVSFCLWSARLGLSADPSMTLGKSRGPRTTTPFRTGTSAIRRKEWLWLLRDRGAIVQAFLIPLTIAASQLLNFRNLIVGETLSWNRLSGIALLFGTYFVWILGPRSLSSEGQALWIPLTWPKGMEDLLKAKARLWFWIATGLVTMIFGYGLYRFPQDSWKILLVLAGWGAFGLSMAYKSVTLVSVPSSSGEIEPIPRSRRWATSLGMLTFGAGILCEQWSIAVTGIVYSWMTAAALWQNFRGRLPFLFDPWSEQLPPPPTLMHAMIAISLLVEVGAVITGIAIGVADQRAAAVTMAMTYTSCAALTWFFMSDWLKSRGTQPMAVWCWPGQLAPDPIPPAIWSGDGSRGRRFLFGLAIGGSLGIIFGLLAHGYTALLQHFHFSAEQLRTARDVLEQSPNLKIAYGFLAICVAPFVEEYLFRGLLFRALDREWGGWRAVLGNAAFFAIYHPPLSWPPVFLVGALNALLFKKTGRLAPAVALHMIYNAVVLLSA